MIEWRKDASGGSDTEDPATRDFWTGDVWKVVPILTKLRPGMKLMYVDCPPSGLLVCAHLDPLSKVVEANYSTLLRGLDFAQPSEFGMTNLRSLCPTLDSTRLLRVLRQLRDALQLY